MDAKIGVLDVCLGIKYFPNANVHEQGIFAKISQAVRVVARVLAERTYTSISYKLTHRIYMLMPKIFSLRQWPRALRTFAKIFHTWGKGYVRPHRLDSSPTLAHINGAHSYL